MAAVYQIKKTDGVQTITIQPGTLNGPGGVLADTDLQLYGQGTLAWGAGVDQNLLRLLENFACPEHSTIAGTPADEVDLGISGAGINNPTAGQQWFNTDTGRITVLTEVTPSVFEWVSVSSIDTVMPLNPVIGTLWYDTGVPQLKVWDGAAFESVAERYVLKAGDTMTGDLAMSGNEVTGLPATPSATGASSKEYVDAQIAALGGAASGLYVDAAGDTMSGNLEIAKTSPDLVLNTTAGGDGKLEFQDGGTISGDVLLDLPSNDLRVRRRAGAVTQNEIRMHGTYISTESTANGKIRTPATTGVDNINTTTTKGYVDSEIAAATATGANVFTSLASAALGDIAVTGGKIYINLAAGVNWKQVWPAVYS